MEQKRQVKRSGRTTLWLSLLLTAAIPPAVAGDRVYHYSMADGVPLFTDQRLNGVQPVTVTYYGRPSAVPAGGSCSLDSDRVKRWTAQYGATLRKLSSEHAIDERLIKAVIATESCFNHKAVSRVGAQGLMQLMPDTARLVGVSDPFNPEQNMRGGVRYLRMMLDEFNQNETLALAAYNAGPGAVRKYSNQIPPYEETRNYVAKILKILN